jgi:hypothetical protein
MNAEPEMFRFPELSDEAVLALESLIEDLYRSFQNYYFAQLHRRERSCPRVLRQPVSSWPRKTDQPSFEGHTQIEVVHI